MLTFTDTTTETYRVVSCYACGVRFGIGDDLFRRVVINAKGNVYCPACGARTCWRESDAQRQIKMLRRQLENAATRCETANRRADIAEGSLRATRGVVTKMRKQAKDR